MDIVQKKTIRISSNNEKTNKMNKSLDKLIILLFYISIILLFYYNGLSQSNSEHGEFQTPMFVLLLPYVVSVLQVLRVLSMGKPVLSPLARSWVYIFVYYLFSFIMGASQGSSHYNYNTIWFVVCPPITWIYFSTVISKNNDVPAFLQKWSFWMFLIFSVISLYFIPRSVRDSGLFSSLNTGYYVILSYPLVMLDNARWKKIVATVLLIIIVFLSLKRGGIVAVALSFPIYFILSSNKHLVKKLFFAGISVLLLIYAIPKINEYTNGTLMVRYEFTLNQGDEEGRASMYPIVWKSVCDSSPLQIMVGHGHNGVVNDNLLQGISAHNDYLEFLYDYGIFGLALLLVYQVRLFRITIRSHQSKEGFLPTIFALTSIIVLSMVSIIYSYYYFLLIIPFWCLMHNRLTRSKIKQNENRHSYIQLSY